jgi:phage gpG-like protein
MTPEEFFNRIQLLKKEFKELFDREAPAIAGRVAVSLFKKNFRDEGFFGARWKEVQRRQEGSRHVRAGKRGKHRGKLRGTDAFGRRRILTGATGDLGRSIKFTVDAKGQATVFTDASAFGSRQPYGRVHNEGLRAGRGGGFVMPRRQFIGDHPELRRAIIEKLEEKLREISHKS